LCKKNLTLYIFLIIFSLSTFSRETLGDKDISIQSEEKQILLNVTEFPNLPASYKRMQCNVSNRLMVLITFTVLIIIIKKKIQTNLTNIMANHQLKFSIRCIDLS